MKPADRPNREESQPEIGTSRLSRLFKESIAKHERTKTSEQTQPYEQKPQITGDPGYFRQNGIWYPYTGHEDGATSNSNMGYGNVVSPYSIQPSSGSYPPDYHAHPPLVIPYRQPLSAQALSYLREPPMVGTPQGPYFEVEDDPEVQRRPSTLNAAASVFTPIGPPSKENGTDGSARTGDKVEDVPRKPPTPTPAVSSTNALSTNTYKAMGSAETYEAITEERDERNPLRWTSITAFNFVTETQPPEYLRKPVSTSEDAALQEDVPIIPDNESYIPHPLITFLVDKATELFVPRHMSSY
jgi:hypothetical protein